MRLQDVIVPNEDFQTSINIDFDFGSKSKVEGLIPTDSVCRYLEEILRDVIAPSNHRAKLLVGAYGKGKSHVVLAALTAMWIKDPSSFSRIVSAYKDRGLGFADTLQKFVSDGRRILPVIISGSTSDLRHSLLFALRNALKMAGLSNLMPQTNYDGALATLRMWRDDYPETLSRFEDATGYSYERATSLLNNLDTEAYDVFVEAYPGLTSGSSFDVLDGTDVLSVFDHVLGGLQAHGVSGVYIVYDEFSKYLETSIGRATVEDTRLLQDLAEACNRSGAERQLHLLLISHKSLSNYIDADLPKEKVDGWRGVSGRFDEIEMVDDENQYYELMSTAIAKDDRAWDEWLSEGHGRNRGAIEKVGERYLKNGLFDKAVAETVSFGCYPLHPLTSYLLPRLSEKVAQNERTLFTFICSGGDRSLSEALTSCRLFVSPDAVYDYFEPLLRKEFYSSPLHKTYELARASLAHVERGSLEARIIKTVAAIDVVGQYDRVAPTRQTIIELFSDCGYPEQEVISALESLVAGDSIVYLRRSNSYLKLKETTGVRIDSEVTDRAESLRSSLTCAQILNKEMLGRAFYPSRYNEERGIVRYFDCEFVDREGIESWKPGRRIIQRPDSERGDGEIVAVYCSSPDEIGSLKLLAKDQLSREPMTVVVFPKDFVRIDDALFRLEAASQLKREAGGDSALAEEYEIVVEDYSEIVRDFIAGYFQPELNRSLYYVDGTRRNSIKRKRRLSEELSAMCDATYRNTPRITSESLNKNDLTGTAFSSRTKIIKALCAPVLQRNLGFVGNGQETSMARSALERTGLIRDIEDSVNEPGEHTREIDVVIKTIRDFIEGANDTSFQVLFDLLTGRELGIGLRRGPLPLFLAFVLRDYRDEVKITRDGEERPLNEETLDDLSKRPDAYALTRINWSPEMGEYISELSRVFEVNSDSPSRADLAEAMRLWFAGLPQMTRNCRYDHTTGAGKDRIPPERDGFFRAIRRIDTDTDKLLFEELPRVFGKPLGSPSLVESIKAEKLACDECLSDTIKALSSTVAELFEPRAHDEASLSSVLRDWVDSHPVLESHVFTGVNNQILSAMRAASGDDYVTVGRIAKAAISLRVDDWNDARFSDFVNVLTEMKHEVEGVDEQAENDAGKMIEISFVDDQGSLRRRTFKPVAAGGRSRLLKNSIRACLSEMGGALSPEEKRQVVFEVLEELC